MLVAVGAGDAHGGQGLAGGGGLRVDAGEDEVAFLDRGHGVVPARQAGEKVQVAFVGLVDVADGDGGQVGRDAWREAVAGGDGAQHVAEGLAVVAGLAPGAHVAAQVGAAGADAQHVGGAAVFGLVDHEVALVGERLALPAHAQGDALAARWDGDAAA